MGPRPFSFPLNEPSTRTPRSGDVLDMVMAFRASDTDTPVLLMGYLNVVLKMGEERFALAAGKAGVDGVILVNLPPEEAADMKRLLAAQNMDLVLLAAPTTTPERGRMIAAVASGFLYYVSFRGTTGANLLDPEAVGEAVTRAAKDHRHSHSGRLRHSRRRLCASRCRGGGWCGGGQCPRDDDGRNAGG